ncbi:MAG TPA: DUF1385 domain-containing protein [Bryobacteraceae bacterium]|nr:DUF1385 domain-containing protein [Bryobacteraceae bacterium]
MSIARFLRFSAHLQILPVLESGEETLIGGQAVMEGVMMRAPHSYCVAVRKPNGEVVTEEHPVHRMSEKYPIFRLPILRGLGTLGQAMSLGAKALKFSANAALDEGQEKPTEVPAWMMTLNVLFSLGVMIVLYKVIPLFVATRVGAVVPSLSSRLATNAIDGVVRIVIFLAFLFLLSRLKDIRRVFEYHGAEHKVVFNFEAREPVTIERAQTFPTFHPRCGTNFLAVVLGISFLLYLLLPIDGFLPRLAIRIALLPLVAGVSYEVIRFAAKRQGSLMGLLSKPGLALQRITTQPPDDSQAAVAIHALNGAMALEEKQGGELIIA